MFCDSDHLHLHCNYWLRTQLGSACRSPRAGGRRRERESVRGRYRGRAAHALAQAPSPPEPEPPICTLLKSGAVALSGKPVLCCGPKREACFREKRASRLGWEANPGNTDFGCPERASSVGPTASPSLRAGDASWVRSQFLGPPVTGPHLISTPPTHPSA